LGTVRWRAAFQRGQLDYRIQPGGSLELYDLGSALNDMAREYSSRVRTWSSFIAIWKPALRNAPVTCNVRRDWADRNRLRDTDTLLYETSSKSARFGRDYHAKFSCSITWVKTRAW